MRAKRIASLYHDMKNKLTIAQGNVYRLRSIMERDSPLSAEAERRMESIELSLMYAISYGTEINGLMLDSIAESLSVYTVQERIAALQKIVSALRSQYSCHITVCPAPAEEASYYVNPEAMARIVNNLLDNSQKAGATEVKFEWVARDFSVDVKITDNGRGMDEETLKNLGFGFSTSGSGSGFAWIRGELALMGGTVDVISEPGIFTQVTLRFKRALVKKKAA